MAFDETFMDHDHHSPEDDADGTTPQDENPTDDFVDGDSEQNGGAVNNSNPAQPGAWLGDDAFDVASDHDYSDIRKTAANAQSYNPTGTLLKKPGPGLPEAVLWMVGFFILQVVFGILFVIVFTVFEISKRGPGSFNPQQMQAMLQENMLPYLGGVIGLSALCVVLAGWLRLGTRDCRRKLGTRITLEHFLLILLAAIPMSVFCGHLHSYTHQAWMWLAEQFPALTVFEALEQSKFIEPLAEKASLPIMILAIAVAPAVSEEVMFRGVIGRGLMARHGVVTGVIITSFLFALMHLHPTLVVALFPLAIGMHWVYLQTRSFVAPLMLHFINNAFAAILAKTPEWTEVDGFRDEQPAPIGMIIAAIVCIVFVAIRINRTRIEWKLPDGSNWSPEYYSIESPPNDVDATKTKKPAPLVTLVLAILGIVGFYSAIAYYA